MKNNKFAICISVINIIGTVCLIYCAVVYLLHNTYIANPDAMLPMENSERAGIFLTIGVIPMFIANLLGFLFVVNGENIFIRSLLFVPSILDICLAIHYWI